MSKKEIPNWLSGYRKAVQKQETKRQKESIKKELQKDLEKEKANEKVLQNKKVEAGIRKEWERLKLNNLIKDVFRFTTLGANFDEEATSDPHIVNPLLIKLDWSKRLYRELLSVLPEKESLVLRGGIGYDFEGWDFDQDSGKSTNYGGQRRLLSISLSENFFIIDEKEVWPLREIGGPDKAMRVVDKYLSKKINSGNAF